MMIKSSCLFSFPCHFLKNWQSTECPIPSVSPDRSAGLSEHLAELVHSVHADRGHQHRGGHRHVPQHHLAPQPGLPAAGGAGQLCEDVGAAVRHERPSELRPVGSDALREGPHRLRDGLPDCDRRRLHGHDVLAAIHHRALHGAPRISAPVVQAGVSRHDSPQPSLQPGHAPGH